MANVKQLANAALTEGAGILRLAPNWVPRSFLQPGQADQAASGRLLRLGAHRGGIDERWFASTTPATNEERPPDEGLSYVVFGKERFTLRDAVAELGAELVGEPIWDTVPALAGLLEVLRQHGADPASHAPERRAGEARRPGRQARVVLFPAAAQRGRQQLPLHLLRPGAGHDQAGRRPLPRALERGRQRHPRSLEGLSAASPAPAGWCRRACCTRPAPSSPTSRNGAATCSACISRWSKAGPFPWSLLAKDLPRKSTTTSITWSTRSTGKGTSIRTSRIPLPRADPRRRHRERRLRRSLDRLRQGRRQAALHGQGADRRSRRQVHDQGRRGLRLDHRAGRGPDRQAAAADAGHDPLRRADRGRGVRQRQGGRSRAWSSRTPAASRSSACATSGPTPSPTLRTSAITRNADIDAMLVASSPIRAATVSCAALTESADGMPP